MDSDRRLSLIVGGFVLLSVGALALAIVSLSAQQGLFKPRYRLVAYFENANFQPATVETAGRWKDLYNLPFDVLSDSPPDARTVFEPYYDSRLTPMNMLVDLECMEIIRITTGNDPDLIISIIQAKLGN